MSSALFDDGGDDDRAGLHSSSLFDAPALFDGPSATSGSEAVAPDRAQPSALAGDPEPPPARAPRGPRAAEPPPSPHPPAPAPAAAPPAAASRLNVAPVAASPLNVPPLAVAPLAVPNAFDPNSSAFPPAPAPVRRSAIQERSRRQNTAATGGAVQRAPRDPDDTSRAKISPGMIIGTLIGIAVMTGFAAASTAIAIIVLLIGGTALRNVFKAAPQRRTVYGVATSIAMTLSGLIGLLLHILVGNVH